MALIWKGNEVTAKLLRACERGLLQTASDSVKEAKNTVHKVTSQLYNSIMLDPQGVQNKDNIKKMSLKWGSFSVLYAAAIEFGVKARKISPRFKQSLYWSGLGHPLPIGRSVWHNRVRAFPYLRPSADNNYKKLPNYIRRAFEGTL